MQQAQRVSDTCALFLVDSEGAPGHIVEAGPTQEMFSDPSSTRGPPTTCTGDSDEHPPDSVPGQPGASGRERHVDDRGTLCPDADPSMVRDQGAARQVAAALDRRISDHADTDPGGCAARRGLDRLQLLIEHAAADRRPADATRLYQSCAGHRTRTRCRSFPAPQARATDLRPASRLHRRDPTDPHRGGHQRAAPGPYVGHVLGLPSRPLLAAHLRGRCGGHHLRLPRPVAPEAGDCLPVPGLALSLREVPAGGTQCLHQSHPVGYGEDRRMDPHRHACRRIGQRGVHRPSSRHDLCPEHRVCMLRGQRRGRLPAGRLGLCRHRPWSHRAQGPLAHRRHDPALGPQSRSHHLHLLCREGVGRVRSPSTSSIR